MAANDELQPSMRRLAEHTRNGVIECLTLASSFDAQVRYQADVSIAHVPSEVICMWEDLVIDDIVAGEFADVFSEAEADAVREFDVAWERLSSTLPDPLPALAETQELPEWGELRRAAAAALRAFDVQG